MNLKEKMFCLVLLMMAFGAFSFAVSAQVPQRSPVQQGYYNEGYQDGVNDANANRLSDYKRYKNKFSKQNEPFYKEGYEAGYVTIRPAVARWTPLQRDSYDKGYKFGQDDKKKNISRLPERYEGKYSKTFEAYYRKGYFEGFDGAIRTYDVPVDGSVSPIPGGTPTPTPTPITPSQTSNGTLYWSGRVDDRVSITWQGDSVQSIDTSGTGLSNVNFSVNNALPRRQATLNVRKIEGRGDVTVLQEPNRNNAFTAIIQIYDAKKSADDYRLEINWVSVNIEEPYQSGRITWSGRVDQIVQVRINGADVTSIDTTNSGLYNPYFTINGVLARSPKSVVSARKIKGRGDVIVLQQPNWDNDFTAIVQITDQKKSSDDYQIEITW